MSLTSSNYPRCRWMEKQPASDGVILGEYMEWVLLCLCGEHNTVWRVQGRFTWENMGSFTQPHPTTSAAEEIQKCVLLPIPGQQQAAVRNNTLPLLKDSDRTLKCPDRHSLVPFTPSGELWNHPPKTLLMWLIMTT